MNTSEIIAKKYGCETREVNRVITRLFLESMESKFNTLEHKFTEAQIENELQKRGIRKKSKLSLLKQR